MQYKKTTVYLDEDLWMAFRVRCVLRRTSASQAVGQLIAAWLAAPPPEEPTAAGLGPHKEVFDGQRPHHPTAADAS